LISPGKTVTAAGMEMSTALKLLALFSQEFQDRARPAMGDDQRRGVRMTRADVRRQLSRQENGVGWAITIVQT
jgi:hypothetical protein